MQTIKFPATVATMKLYTLPSLVPVIICAGLNDIYSSGPLILKLRWPYITLVRYTTIENSLWFYLPSAFEGILNEWMKNHIPKKFIQVRRWVHSGLNSCIFRKWNVFFITGTKSVDFETFCKQNRSDEDRNVFVAFCSCCTTAWTRLKLSSVLCTAVVVTVTYIAESSS